AAHRPPSSSACRRGALSCSRPKSRSDSASYRKAEARLAPSLEEPSAFEYRRSSLFDSSRPRCRLLGRAKMVEVAPLPPRRQRLEGALEARGYSEPFAQLLRNRKIRGLPRLHPQPSLLDGDGLAYVSLDGRRL